MAGYAMKDYDWKQSVSEAVVCGRGSSIRQVDSGDWR
jgi:hypothetical protein